MRRPGRVDPSPGPSSNSGRSWKARPVPPTPVTSSLPTCWTTWLGSDRTSNLSKYWDKSFGESLWVTPTNGGRDGRPP